MIYKKVVMGLMEIITTIFWGLNVLVDCSLGSLLYKFLVRPTISNTNEENVTGKVVIITGGSLGIGAASAKEFAKRGAIVVIGDMNVMEGQKTVQKIKSQTGNDNVTVMHLDLSDMNSVQHFGRQISTKYPKIKILLNNAGIAGSSKDNKKTKDGFNLHVAVNHLGHFLLTNLLLENLKRETKSRVVAMSSTMQLLSKLDLDDLMMDKSGFGIERSLPYANTKFCNALFIKELGKRVAKDGILTYALCPGVVDTTIFESMTKLTQVVSGMLIKVFGVTPEEAASEYVLYCALDKSIEHDSGKMFQYRKPYHTANRRLDDQLAMKLWNKSAQLVKLDQRLSEVNHEQNCRNRTDMFCC